jgi:hypothetical protein
MDAFISPNDTGGVMKLVDSSAVVDNIFIFTDGTDKFRWTNNWKGVYPLSQAKVLAGDSSDKTTILQAVLNHADIKVVELDAQQVITISGTLNCNGKIIQFTNGSKFTGTATIDNAVILGEDNDQLFDTTITLTNSKSGKSYFSAKWYGALGNGNNIDTEALQKVLDTCVNNKTRRIFFPQGTYKIDKGIYVRLGNTSSVFAENITIEGPVVTVNGAGTEASIVCTNPNSFALGLQRVKGTKVKNLSFIGPNHAMDTFKLYDVIQNPDANFSAGMRDERTSPNAGIVIDPFSHSGHTSMYPGFEALYTEVQRGGSTDVIIENCDVKHFVVNYMISPTGYMQNAERIVIRDCWGDRCKSAIAVGQHQTRSVYVENFGCWVKTETVLDSERYGEGTGCPPDVNGLNIAGGVRYVCRLNNWFSNGMHIVNMHAEELGSLGGNFSSAIGKLTIKDSFIDIIGGMTSTALTGASIQAAITQFQGDYLVLENCTFHSYSNNISVPINIAANNVVFTNCTLGLIPFAQGGSGQITFNACTLVGNGIPFGDGHVFYGKAPAEISYTGWPFMTKMEWFTGFQVASLRRVKREKIDINNWPQQKGISLIPYDTQITLSSINMNNLEATFNIPASSEFFKFLQIHDVLVTFTTDEFGRNVTAQLGKVWSKNASTGEITLKNIMKGASLATPYFLALYKQEVLIAPLIIGNLSSGSNTITNVLLENYAVGVPIGVMINHKLLPIGTYIVSYDHSTGTITLSNNATGTATRQTFVSSDWEGLQVGVPDLYHPRRIGYKIGDKIINDDFITYPNVLHWTCTKPGVTGSPLLPEFAVTNL